MYKKVLILYFLILQSLLAQHYQSIHQYQLEYYNANYVMPERTDTNIIINPIFTRTRNPSKEVFGYHPYWMGTAWMNYDFNLISTLAYFSAEVTSTGELSNLHGWPVASLINEAHAHGTKVVLCATLFNSGDITTLLSNAQYRQNLIDNLLSQVQLGNADGVNIDFESFPVSQRNNMVTFITELTEIFHTAIPGSQVTLAMPPVDWSNAWDYNALASISDGLFIMGYNYHYSGSSNTGPNSPLSGPGYTLTWTVLDYLNKTNFQTDKLILGIPYYGFEWPSASEASGATTNGIGVPKFYSEIEGLAQSYGKLWHSTSQTPWYHYNNNGWNQGWYDDSLSLSLKYDFAVFNDLKGIGIWALGYDDGRPELWDLLHTKFGNSELPAKPSNLYMENIGQGSIKIDFNASENTSDFIVLRSYTDEISEPDTIGIFSNRPIIINDLVEDEPHYISIIAKNSIGSSEPTEMLGIIPSNHDVKALIINGFDRIEGTNNTFDFIRQHGNALHAHGLAFDAASNEAVVNQQINLLDYQFVNWILGEEGTSTSAFSYSEQNKIIEYLELGNFLFISGSEIGYDLEEQGSNTDKDFYRNYLKANYISDAAGGYQGVYSGYGLPNTIFNDIEYINYDNGNQGTYNVDWPDGIKPIGGASLCAAFTGTDYNTVGGMGIEYEGTFGLSNFIGGLVYLTVGFEAIYPESKRIELMFKIIEKYESQLSSISEVDIYPSNIKINNIFPNPSNSSTTISFSVSSKTLPVKLSIKNIVGQLIYQTHIEPLSNNISWVWDGTNIRGYNCPSGTYFISLVQNNNQTTKKFTLLK